MDNGHHNAIFSSPDVDDNLNESSWQRSLEISAPAGMPAPEQIATTEDTGLYTPENVNNTPNPQTPETAAPFQDEPPKFGQITPINELPQIESQTPKTYDPGNIKTTGDHLEKSSIAEIDHAIDKLNQDGNLSSFYDEIRGMTEVNLNNSFNRKLYNDGMNDANSMGISGGRV